MRSSTVSCSPPPDMVVMVGTGRPGRQHRKVPPRQPVAGLDTAPGRNSGVLVRHRRADAVGLVRGAIAPGGRVEELTMVEAVAYDTQRLLALNEICPGPARPPDGHATAWPPAGAGTRARRRPPPGCWSVPAPAPPGGCALPVAGARRRHRAARATRSTAAVVRARGVPPTTGTSKVAGEQERGQALRLTVESDRMVVFGNGMEADALELTWGRSVQVEIAAVSLRRVT